jgi:hypothetical protein
MSPESEEHKKIKEIVLDRLKKMYASALKEYPDAGNIADVKAVTSEGISIFVENVWTSKKSNFQRDLNILHRSPAEVKILIVNPEILREESLVREFEKTRQTEIKKGYHVSEMIDGSLILNNPQFVNIDFCRIVKELVGKARKTRSPLRKFSRTNNKLLKHSKFILLTRSDYQGLDNWARVTLMENLIQHSDDQLETRCLMQHFETGYHDELWAPLMEYKSLLAQYDSPVVPFPPRFQEEIGGYGKSWRDEFERIPEEDRKRLLELKQQFLDNLNGIIFGVKNNIPLKGRCNYCLNR